MTTKQKQNKDWQEKLKVLLIKNANCFHFDDEMPDEMRVEHHFSYCLEGLEGDLIEFIRKERQQVAKEILGEIEKWKVGEGAMIIPRIEWKKLKYTLLEKYGVEGK